jgi:hypothetical protein
MGFVEKKQKKKRDKAGGLGPQTCHRQTDGSYSWTQPDSTGLSGWEGYCGQTCVANLLTTSTPNSVSPETVIDVAADWTPGSRPSTLLRALNRLGGNHRRFRISHSRSLAAATPRRPIGCLLQWSSGSMHWVMVVRVDATHVHFNHWGRQSRLTRAEFERRWGFDDQNFGDSVVSFLGGLSPHTSLR